MNALKTNRRNHPNRVRLLLALDRYLEKYPDIRIGQAIDNATHHVNAKLTHGSTCVFYIEDGALAEALEEMASAPETVR